jgi:hypothetical protein
MMPYDTPAHIADIRARLLALIAACEGDSTEAEPVPSPAPWAHTVSVPANVGRQIRAIGLPAPTAEQWAALSDVQRFALLKLTREGHENKKLPLALQEFGLMPQS